MRLRTAVLALVLATFPAPAKERAKNIILFLGDAGGISTLNAASIHGYKEPRALYIQRMPHIALSETSSTNSWVTDSAAGMTAIVTGRKTANGVLSEAATPEPGSRHGAPFKTLLEYAEQHGLSTGVVSNMSMADATPAACYAHMHSRGEFGGIFTQVWRPRFGDGVDVVIGNGRKRIREEAQALGADIDKELRASGRSIYESVDAIPANARRVVALFDDNDFDVDAATVRAIRVLLNNPKGFFLMVEWDLHPTRPERCLNTVVKLDRLIRRTAEQMQNDTLILFTADHSFDFRLLGGKKGSDIKLPAAPNAGKIDAGERPDVVIGTSHTGEEVLVAAQGPGSERVTGILSNTDLFGIMLSAYGWTPDAP